MRIPAEDRAARRRARLVQELDDENVALIEPAVLDPALHTEGIPTEADLANVEEILLDELLYARRPPVHEGRTPSYGSLTFVGSELHPDVEDRLRVVQVADQWERASVRELANGMTAFVVHTTEGPSALAFLDRGDELSLVRLADELGCWIVQRHPTGTVRVFGRERLLMFENDEWITKPYAHTRWFELAHVAAVQSDVGVIGPLLDLCLHLLSARHIGATLVWMIDGSVDDVTPRLSRQPRSAGAELHVDDPDHAEALATLLASLDGACLVSGDGTVVGVEAFLGGSEQAVAHVRSGGGTRHASAARFSFDEPRAVLFVVSADGPVTVFSDGIDVLHLDRDGTFGLELAAAFPDKSGHMSVELGRETCPTCGKPLVVEKTVVLGWKEWESADCPVCGRADVATGLCFNIRVRVAKPWEDEHATVLWGWGTALAVAQASAGAGEESD
jgi:DNA integrity scanning protein DisA with diadenylate cyclase activity